MNSETLNKRKRELGLTTEQLSQLSGVPVGTINKILNGETRSPRYHTLQALGKVLFGEEGAPSENDQFLSADADLSCEVRESAAPYLTKRQGEYTVEDYRRLPEDLRAELIDGTLIFSEAPTFTHQELVTELLFELQMFIRTNQGSCRVLPAPLDVQLDCDDRTVVQPDIALIGQEKKITQRGICGAPDFCIEIVSDASRKRDYGIKMQKYMNAGVREYWIVDPRRRKIVCYWFEGEDAPEIMMYTFDDQIPVRIYSGRLEIDFRQIRRRLWKEEST